MKYTILLYFLRWLVVVKRGVWWTGHKISDALGHSFLILWRVVGKIKFRANRFVRRWHFTPGLILTRDVLVALFLIMAATVGWTQSRATAGEDLVFRSRQTEAFGFFGDDEEYIVEEATTLAPALGGAPSLSSGALAAAPVGLGSERVSQFSEVVPTGFAAALLKPALLRPSIQGLASARSQAIEYVIQSGDTLGAIAEDFGVSVATILWENNLTLRSLLRPGDILKIPPTSGVFHLVRRGDTIKKIAALYGAKAEDIIAFNQLPLEGGALKAGARLMVPNGVKAAVTPRPSRFAPRVTAALPRRAAPPGSSERPSSGGFVWPASARYISQYFNWRHNGLDIAGPWATPIYASKAGVVERAQCGWNGGYGCYLIIDHGGGFRTLYGHNAQLLVAAGDEVERGQTVALMGNTGNTRGRTGIHVHFEIIVNGRRKNPLQYVR